VAVALFLGDMDHATILEPVESARGDISRSCKLTNAEASQGTGGCELLSVVGAVARHSTRIVAGSV
jgi:hypothetical protein